MTTKMVTKIVMKNCDEKNSDKNVRKKIVNKSCDDKKCDPIIYVTRKKMFSDKL